MAGTDLLNSVNSSASEATAREMTKQGALINALCDKIEDMVGLIVTKSSEQSLDGETYQKLLRTGTSTFVRLRLLNRRLHEDKVALRSSVGELKRKIDSLALDLESEEREIAYIKHEIESTQKLETIYQTIGIIPEEEFLSSAPEEFLKDTDTPHKLMLSRLRYEIRQREMLVEAKNAARAKRDELRAAKRKRIDKLEAIDSHMKNYVKTISLLGKSLGIDSNDSKEQTDIEMMSPEDADVASGSKRSHAARDGTLSNIGTPRV